MPGKHQQTEVLQTEDDILLIEEDDEVLLIEEDNLCLVDDTIPGSTEVNQKTKQKPPWQILVVDDEPAVHQATQLALANFQFRNIPLLLLHAYSGVEAKALLEKHPSISFVLLDVVMETNDAGLKVARYIRDVLKNKRIQIILRTGQPGEAPETSIIQDYEINDYKLKTELTRQRLITTITTALRGYCNVVEAEEKTLALEQTLHKLQQTQIQLIHSEKMSALGNLVASVAHEINNPVSCIMGNVEMLEAYTQRLINIATLYAQQDHVSSHELQQQLGGIDLDYVREDLPQMIRAMQDSSDRIISISN